MSDVTPPVTPGAAAAPTASPAPNPPTASIAAAARRRPFAFSPPPVPLVILLVTIAAVLVLTACAPGGAEEPSGGAATAFQAASHGDRGGGGDVRGSGGASADANARFVEQEVVAGLAEESAAVRAALAEDRSMPPACMAVIGLVATTSFPLQVADGTVDAEEGAALEAMRAEWWGRVPPELEEALGESERRMMMAADRLRDVAERPDPVLDAQAAFAEAGLESEELVASMAEVEHWLVASCQPDSW